ncbi:TonB-dependent receptor [Pedobacter sp. PLR]|uniref:TonB-dependent receptor n=1 Tax=Pedobacter sp. PLR TaxID=2994465 RepID=UPI00224698CB|nr:TonB-dependent receptor [Pedobacter sp. PLR]MCX2454239.1 TonB-dependent receptor [Pedobacter sp. PLR]
MNNIYLISLTCFLASLAFPNQLQAQETATIKGLIQDEQGNPASNINIRLTTQPNVRKSDHNGIFMLHNLPFGDHQLIFTGIGFQPDTILISLTELQKEAELLVHLKDSDDQLQEVVVMGRKKQSYVNTKSFIGSKIESKITEVPQTISTVTKELMEDKQAFLITDVVADLPGVTQFSAYDDLTIRGFRNGNETGFRLVNGLRSGYGYGTSYFRIPLTLNLESIEVLKGPGAALFGDISPGGTVNLNTKKPLEERRHSISVSAGSFNTIRSTLDFTGNLDEEKKILYRLNVGHETTNTFRDVNARKSIMIAPTFTFRPTANTTINAELNYSNFDGYLDRGMGIKSGDFYGLKRSFTLSQPSDYFRVNDISLNASMNHRINDKLSINANYMKFIYAENLSEHRTLNSFADAPLNTVMNMRYIQKQTKEFTDNVSAYVHYKGANKDFKYDIVGGLDYVQYETDKRGHQWEARSQTIDGKVVPLTFDLNNPTYELRNPALYNRLPLAQFFTDYLNSSYQTTGVFIQNRINYKEKLNLLFGIRYESYGDKRRFEGSNFEKVKQGVFLPRIGLTYAINRQFNYFASYSQGFIPINPMFVRNPENYGRTEPFKSQTSYQLETGLKSEFFNQRVFSSLSFYHIERQNMLVNTGQITDNGNPIYRQNGRVKSQGVEFDLKGSVLPFLDLSANYAFNITEVMESDLKLEKGMVNANAPKHLASLWAKYTQRHGSMKGLGIGVGGQYVGKKRMENTVQNIQSGELEWNFWPSYFVANAAIYYKLDKMSFAVNANNLFDKYYFVGGFDYTRAFPGSPRNFMTSIKYTF